MGRDLSAGFGGAGEVGNLGIGAGHDDIELLLRRTTPRLSDAFSNCKRLMRRLYARCFIRRRMLAKRDVPLVATISDSKMSSGKQSFGTQQAYW